MPIIRSLLLLAASVFVSARALAQRAARPFVALPSTESATNAAANAVKLDVPNNSQLDVVVYSFRAGERHRLGMVMAHVHATLDLPLNYTDGGQAQLYLHRIGERPEYDFLTNSVHVDSELRPTLDLESDSTMTSLAAFPDLTR